MLTIKAPIELKCGRITASSQEAFGERIRGNYEVIAARIEREDLLHVVMAPPEVYIGGGDMTSLVEDTRIRNVHETKLTVINNLLNRIAVTEDVKLSYQDRVYITDVLQRLGVTDVSQFMRQVFELKQENRNTEELTQLYWNHMEELRSTVEQYAGEPGVSRSVTEYASRENTLHLHEEIMNRLQTGAVYQILSNFYTSRTGAQYVSAQELNFAEQQRTVSRILLNRLETEAAGTQVPFVYRHENYYEENYQDGDRMTETAVNSRISSAVLLNLADSLIQNLSVRQIRGADIWVSLENSLYQTAENTLQRMFYRTESQNVRPGVRQAAGTQILRTQERELAALRELLEFAGSEARFQGGRTVSVQGAEALPGREVQPADIRYGEIVGETTEKASSPETLTERIRESITTYTEHPERNAESPESRTERKTEQKATEQPEKAEEKSQRGEAQTRARRRMARKSGGDASREDTMNAPTPAELTFLEKSATDSTVAEESSQQIRERSRDEEQRQAQLAQTLKQYFSAIYPPEEAEESLRPVFLSHPRPGEQESAAENRGRGDILPEGSGEDAVRSVLERWQTSEERKPAAETLQPGQDFAGRETVVYTGREPEAESMEERQLVRERTERLVRERGQDHIRQDTAEQIYYPEMETISAEEPETLPQSGGESLERELEEINRRNIENYERYQQLLKTRQQEEAERKRREKPPLLRMREESLRALENPQQVLKEHQNRTPEDVEKASKADRRLLESLPEETRVLYQRLEELQEARRREGRQGEMEQSRDISRLARDVRLIERENRSVAQEATEDQSEIREVLKTVAERGREYEKTSSPPDSRTEHSHQELSLVHKSVESTLDEETLQELLAQNQTIRRSTELTNRVEENVKTQTTSVQKQTSRTEVEEREDIERLIQRGLRQQMGALSDQIYTKLERRLASEKRRRGY